MGIMMVDQLLSELSGYITQRIGIVQLKGYGTTTVNFAIITDITGAL
jgi:hypothetical protein